MEVIYLPLVAPDIDLNDALQAMHRHVRAAVVRRDHQAYSLIRAVDIYSGLAHKLARLSALKSRFTIHEVSNLDVNHWHLNLADPQQTATNFEQLLDNVNAKYGLLDSMPGFVRLVTRHEGYANQFSSAPSACYCDNEEYMHPYPPPVKSNGDICYCTHTISCV